MIKFRLILLVATVTFLLLVLATSVVAQEETEVPVPYTGLINPFPWDDASAQEVGKGLYQQQCQGCHGVRGDNLAGSDFSVADYPQRLGERPDLYFWILSEGNLDNGMPSYKSSLSAEQRWQVLTYLWSLALETASPEMTSPADASNGLECLSCHTRALMTHDKLGSASEACWVCHDSINIGKLRLLDGTQLSLADSVPLCGQCHSAGYEAWNEGEHGVVAGKDGEPGFPDAQKPKCISCHNPHQPQMDLAVERVSFPLPPSSEDGTLDCLSCHVRVLEGHDKLGSGSKACWACHYNREMGALHLAGGDVGFPLADSPQLCAQCHQERYQAWDEGTHGAPAWTEGTVEVHGTERVGCIGCHDPHQPQIVFSNITKPHPAPQPPPSPPSAFLFVLLGTSVLLAVAIGFVVLKKGEQT